MCTVDASSLIIGIVRLQIAQHVLHQSAIEIFSQTTIAETVAVPVEVIEVRVILKDLIIGDRESGAPSRRGSQVDVLLEPANVPHR